MNHENIRRIFLPILGWISIVEGYIVLFGGSVGCLIAAIVLFIVHEPIDGLSFLFGGVIGSIVAGISSVAMGDMMLQVDRLTAKDSYHDRLAEREKKRAAVVKAPEPAPVPDETPKTDAAVKPTTPAVPKKEEKKPIALSPKRPGGPLVGDHVSYQGKICLVTYVLAASGRISIQQEDGKVEVIDPSDLD
jgi:hypothetical protein